jgi:cell division protein ZapA (FtsZ GTPase activity inhibitor)
MSTSTITITLNNKNFELACSEESKIHLQELAENLNNKIIEIKNNNKTASYELLLVMAALSLQDQANIFNKEIELQNPNNDSQSELIDALSNIATRLEDISNCSVSIVDGED